MHEEAWTPPEVSDLQVGSSRRGAGPFRAVGDVRRREAQLRLRATAGSLDREDLLELLKPQRWDNL
jgi:hypothetical protein